MQALQKLHNSRLRCLALRFQKLPAELAVEEGILPIPSPSRPSKPGPRPPNPSVMLSACLRVPACLAPRRTGSSSKEMGNLWSKECRGGGGHALRQARSSRHEFCLDVL